METLQKIALIFTIIGAVVWGIYGLFDINIVAALLCKYFTFIATTTN